MRKSILYNWWLSGRNKNNILLYIGGQSNEGTDPATGRSDTLMPSYLTSPSYTNVFFWDIDLANDYDFETYVPNFPTRQMGYIDQAIYILSNVYENVYVVKRALTGSQLYPITGGETAFPLASFLDRCSRAKITMDALFPNDYDEVVVWGQGESDAENTTEANAYKSNLLGVIDDFNGAVDSFNIKWVLRRQGDLTAIDFPFIDIVNQAKDEIASENGFLTVNADGLRTINDTDDAHFGASGSISLGGFLATKILQTVGRSKPDNTKPVLQSATVDSTGLSVTLVFSKTINPGIRIYPFQFAIGDRTISSAVQSGNNIVLTLKSPVRIGDTDTLSYTKDLFYRENVQDLLSNELDSFTGFVLINNSTLVSRNDILTIYESNFVSSVDSWTNVQDTSISFNQTIDGVDGCLKITCTGGTNAIAQVGVSNIISGNEYRISYDLYTSPEYGKDLVGRNVFLGIVSPAQTIMDMDNLYKRDTWQSYKIDYTSTGGVSFRLQLQDVNPNDFIAIKNFKIQRVRKDEAAATPYTSQLQSAIDTSTTNGYTLPSTFILNSIDTFLRGLDSDGLLSRMKRGHILHAGSSGFGTISLHGTSSLNTIVGSPVFTEERGVKSQSSAYIRLPFKSDEYSGIESNFSIAFYVSDSSNLAGNESVYGVRTRSDVSAQNIVQTKYTANGLHLNYDTTLTTFTNADHKGLYVNTVTATNKVLYKDGTKLSNVSYTPLTPNISTNYHLLANNSASATNGNTPANFYLKNVSAIFFFDKFTDADELAFRTRFNTYKSSVEIP